MGVGILCAERKPRESVRSHGSDGFEDCLPCGVVSAPGLRRGVPERREEVLSGGHQGGNRLCRLALSSPFGMSDRARSSSVGSYQTPQILELSGIGNKELLDKHGIETLIDLPGVGENLREYLYRFQTSSAIH